jgi:acetolactate synthase regulatory subunit
VGDLRFGCGIEEFGDARIDGVAFVRNTCASQDLVVEIDGEVAVLENQREEVEDVAGVELARVDGNFCHRRVRRRRR